LTLAQDIGCFVLKNNEVSNVDKSTLQSGTWIYQPPTIGPSVIPQPIQFINPSSLRCSTSSNGSKKGLLGLLGILGLIPLLLCGILFFICCIRRKQAGPNVQFATFDPIPAASVIAEVQPGMVACEPIGCMDPGTIGPGRFIL